jgi:hypothetical protein
MSRSPTKASSPSKASPAASSPRDDSRQQATLSQLDYLDSYFASFASRVESIDRSIDMKKPSTLMTAKHDLAQIIGDLESLQANEVSPSPPSSPLFSTLKQIDGLTLSSQDVGNGNREEALSHRKHLHAEIENMLEQTQLLYKQIDATLQRITAKDPSAASGASGSSSSSTSSSAHNSEPPLQREEIAKLLLLSSRAHSVQQISVQQWRGLKDEICRRKGYLRQILRQSDISSVMAALASIQVS